MTIPDFVLLLAVVVVMVWFIRLVFGSRRDEPRFAEDDARTYFDEHGYWPDETAVDAASRSARAAEAERVARSQPRRRGL